MSDKNKPEGSSSSSNPQMARISRFFRQIRSARFMRLFRFTRSFRPARRDRNNLLAFLLSPVFFPSYSPFPTLSYSLFPNLRNLWIIYA